MKGKVKLLLPGFCVSRCRIYTIDCSAVLYGGWDKVEGGDMKSRDDVEIVKIFSFRRKAKIRTQKDHETEYCRPSTPSSTSPLAVRSIQASKLLLTRADVLKRVKMAGRLKSVCIIIFY